MISKEHRHFGIKSMEAVPWGTNSCYFFQDKEDLINIIKLYFKNGLENNEYCIWVTSDLEMKKTLINVMPSFNEFLKKKQFEIIYYEDWYSINNHIIFPDNSMQDCFLRSSHSHG